MDRLLRPSVCLAALVTIAVALVSVLADPLVKTPWTLTGWNNLGMHCMDSDYSVMSVLPPYNTIHAQLTDPTGTLVKDPVAAGVTVTYQAVADGAGSINTTSGGGKTNFWQHVQALFGASLPVDQGLKGNPMPGAPNTPRPMTWDPANNWWIAEGIPLTPYDDARAKNAYPVFHLVARDHAGAVLATADIVLPVSDEMDCRACHASGSAPDARPSRGWAWHTDAELDYRLNLLLRHDDHFAAGATYRNAAAAVGYATAGLYPTVMTYRHPVLCAACHSSEALGTASQPGVPPLTRSVHSLHATANDPVNGMTLDASNNRSACYRCHPGSTTKCLRGAMGKAVAADGSMAMQCQACHGSMSQVGAQTRTGWLNEPSCQNCHTGTATSNNGQIRYTTVFDYPGHPRQPVNTTFATNANTPAAGLDLFRFSHGHGGVGCEGCHGSTHAEFPTSHTNDNVLSRQVQGHVGMLVECDTCHVTSPPTVVGGPHGMHPVGQVWVNQHPDLADGTCTNCHGSNSRGTELSRSQADRTLSTTFGTKSFWRGFQVGCYGCHDGPGSESANPNRAPVVTNTSGSTPQDTSLAVNLPATDPDGNALTLRIVGQPSNGTVGLAGRVATYHPFAGYSGSDSFTFAAWDGSIDSNLGTATVTVAASPCRLTCTASVPASGASGASIAFSGSAASPGCTGPIGFDWTFGDGQPHDTSQNPVHSYFGADRFRWTMTVTAGPIVCQQSGTIRVLTTPLRVPSYATQVGITTANHGQDATVTWDASNCPASDYHVVYGYGSGLRTWTVAGGRCAIGSTGSYTWTAVPDPRTDSSRLLWFLVVGDSGTTEGSWGVTSAGAERGGTAASRVCGMTAKSLAGSCPAP